ncbi:MAG: caspase family protein [Bacteroidales bacterium]|nr:caspase family protein [Bacteroidales bacterium]
MKKIILIILVTLFGLGVVYADKYALIIAIGEYDQSKTGWYPISAQNDVPLIEKTLTELGFVETNVLYLADADATKQGIVNAMQTLYSMVSAGDHVVIHYSGHGHQIFDDNEDEIDGLDEALVSYDAPMKMFEGYDGSLHFRDDELGEIINKFRIKLGSTGHILLFLDSCHSGTGTRGSAKVRGGAPPLIPENWSPKAKKDNKVGFGISSNEGVTGARGVTTENLAKFVVFSGASANELNYETYDDDDNAVGSLSYCIYKSFAQMKEGDTYRQVFARIMAEMATKAPFQNPAIEGDIDYAVFGGDYAVQNEYFNLINVKSDSIVEISAGRLAGINPGTIIAFVQPGTPKLVETTELICTGKVVSASNFSSKVVLNSRMKFKNDKSAWAFIQTRTFSDQKIQVFLDSKMDADVQKLLKNEIENSNFAEICEDSPEISLEYKKSRGAQTISVNNAHYNQNLNKISSPDTQILKDDVMATLNNYAQGKIIKNLDFYDENYDLVMELIPVNAKVSSDGSFEILGYPEPNEMLINDVPSYSPDNMALIKVTNYGAKKAYFNIIDIQPDGFINPVIPTGNDIDGREYFLEPGETAVLKNTLVMFGPPYGNEIFKLIATDKPFNLTATIQQHGNSTRGAGNNIFENALQIGQTGKNTRGASTVSAKKQDEKMCTYEYTFRIVK